MSISFPFLKQKTRASLDAFGGWQAFDRMTVDGGQITKST
jgi:hypothetical protein